MSKYIVFLLLLLLIVTLIIFNEKFIITTLPLVDTHTLDITEEKNTEKKRNCNYPIEWKSDMNMFNNKEIEVNPFAKSDAEHCRTNFQCKSKKCNQFYCN